MILNISEHASNLLTCILQELGNEMLEYTEENGGLPSCIFCYEVAVVGPDKILHTADCLTIKALQLVEEIAK